MFAVYLDISKRFRLSWNRLIAASPDHLESSPDPLV